MCQDLLDQGVREASTLGDRVETLCNLGDLVVLDESPAHQLVPHDDRRDERQAMTLTCEQPEHRHVVDLGENDRPDAGELRQPVERDVDAAIERRGRDWSQIHPEWGLARNAEFIAARRHRTRGIDLEGRAFLHDYNWRRDEDWNVLELILTAPTVVASWINLQYYGSAMNQDAFGSGNKVLHNVVGTLDVLDGNAGDLRVGLPSQAVHDGTKPVHEPVRLNVFIEAPTEQIDAILDKHDNVRELVDNGWIHLLAIGEDGEVRARAAAEGPWAPVTER